MNINFTLKKFAEADMFEAVKYIIEDSKLVRSYEDLPAVFSCWNNSTAYVFNTWLDTILGNKGAVTRWTTKKR